MMTFVYVHLTIINSFYMLGSKTNILSLFLRINFIYTFVSRGE